MKPILTVAIVVNLLLLFSQSGRAAEGCIERAADIPALLVCGESEIEPLEKRTEALFAALIPRANRDEGILTSLHESKRLWNAYRHNQCRLEGSLALPSDGRPNLLSTRATFACVKRTLLQRIGELEALENSISK